jgi:hypothetical protein
VSIRILVGGKRNSGKSTLACSLYATLRNEGEVAELFELDPYSDTCDCILGRKPWASRKKNPDPPREEFLRRNELFRGSLADIVIGDLPGRIHAKNRLLLDGADGAIIVDRSPLPQDRPHDPTKAEFDLEHHDPTVEQWQEHFAAAGVPVLLIAFSLREHEVPPATNGFFPVRGLEKRAIVRNSDIVIFTAELRRILGRVPV